MPRDSISQSDCRNQIQFSRPAKLNFVPPIRQELRLAH